MKLIFDNSLQTQAAAFYLRYQIFVLEQKIASEFEFDQLDTPDRKYVVIFDKDLPVATVRFQKIDDETLNPDRLCVHANYRKQGLGEQLLDQIEKQGTKEGCQRSILSAEVSAEGFYKKLGYQVISDVFEEDGIPVIKMQKNL